MRYWFVPLALALVLCSAWACAAATDGEVYIYRGEPIASLGVTLSSWGSGKASESIEKILTGTKSIKITTQGLYAGARIEFPQPVTLFSGTPDPKRYAVFTFYFNETRQVDPAAGSPYAYEVEPYTVPKANIVHFVFESDTGLKVSAEEYTRPLDPDDNWVRIGVPFAKFKLPEGTTDFRLRRLIITSDIPSTFFLGEIKMMTDDNPIKVESLSDQTVAVMDEVLFAPQADGGISALDFAWDFDSSNGVQPEGTDRVGRYIYTKGGEFNVTLTVRDPDGIKDPVVVKTKVTVTD